MFDAIIVGCGISGAVLARRIAEENDQKILIVEKNDYVGGYCYDFRNEDGILIHLHGPHIFRTNSKLVWNFLSRFTQWQDYQHRVLTNVNGLLYPMPINLDTVNQFLGTNYSCSEVMEYFEKNKRNVAEIKNVKDVIESQVGPEFYHAFYKNYTEKQWGMACEELPPEIISRIPIRSNRDNRYFTHKYQALPKDGYTQMIRNILKHPNIHVLLNTSYADIRNEISCKHLYYSGPIDEFYNYKYGRLPYRGVSFEFITVQTEYYQPAAVVNYPNNYDYTRITEFKHFYNQKTDKTVIAKEYPGGGGNLPPSYPVPTAENKALYKKYLDVPNEHTTFIGRLGEYRYYSMDEIVEKMLEMEL